jgi:hypothetical protein
MIDDYFQLTQVRNQWEKDAYRFQFVSLSEAFAMMIGCIGLGFLVFPDRYQ